MSDEPEQKVQLSDRDALRGVIYTTLAFMARTGQETTMEELSNLLTDDIISSHWNATTIAHAWKNATDLGYEKGLRDAISAVGEMERTAGFEGGPLNLIEYDQAQRHIAQLSKEGLAQAWAEPIGETNE